MAKERRNTKFEAILAAHGLISAKGLPIFNVDEICRRAVVLGYPKTAEVLKRRLNESLPSKLEISKGWNISYLNPTSLEFGYVSKVLSELGLSLLNAAKELNKL